MFFVVLFYVLRQINRFETEPRDALTVRTGRPLCKPVASRAKRFQIQK